MPSWGQVAWSGSLFVALGPNGYTFGSPDGMTWTPGANRITATSSIFVIAWGNHQFVVVGTAGAIHTSPDGAHWTARTSGPIRDLKDATWGGTQFVAVGEYETILTSPNGLDWTDRTTAPATDFSDTLTGVTWGRGQFVAVGYHYLVSTARSAIRTSPDGVNWTSRSPGLPSNATLHAVTWADDQFVAVGDHSTTGVDSPIVTSLDAVTWTPIESGTTAALYDVTGNGQVFVAVGATSTVLTSPNGVDWTVHDISPVFSGTLWGVVWGQNQFVAVGSAGTIVTSPDGATWAKQTSGTSQQLNAITWNDRLFVAVGNGGAILTSPDGVGWTLRRSGWTPDLVGVTGGDTQFVAVGNGGTILNDQPSGTPPDPPNWITSPLLSRTIVAGDTLRFTARGVADTPATYAWDFGDGRVSSLRSPRLVSYASPGAFRVVCTARVGAAAPTSDSRSYIVVADTGDLPDLQVSTVRLDGALAVGQPMPVTYTANNTGQGPAGPSWRDALYLSRDADLDTTDLLLDSALVNRTLATGESYQNVLTVTLPTAHDGACHLILALNDQWDMLERRRSNNEHATPITSLVPTLSAATPTSVPYAAGRVEQYFRIIATGEENLLLDLTGVPRGLDVVIEFNNLPIGWTHAYRVRGGEFFVAPAATPGDWFLMVSGSMDQPGTYALGFSLADLILSGTSPARHNAEADLELTLTGAGFFRPLGVSLVSEQAQVHAAAAIEVDSFSQARARFTAGTVPPGLYNVRIERDGHVAERPNALEITANGSSDFKAKLTLRSAFGYVEAPPTEADASTTVSPDSPTGATVPLQVASVGNTLVFTNTAESASGNGFLFTLGDEAPEGVSIDPSSGILSWTPNCAQANQRYLVTVWVADALSPNLMDAIPITVDVGECVVPALDRFVVRAGAGGRVPLNLAANVPLTQVTMRIGIPGGRLTNLWIEPCVPEVCSNTLTSIPDPPAGQGDLFNLSLSTCANQSLKETQQVAWLHFTALSNQPSAFLNLRLDTLGGLPADGSPVQQLAPQTLRLVIVGEEPVLEGWLDADQQPNLILYAPRGTSCVIQQSRLLPAIEWSMDSLWEMRDLFVPVPITGPDTGMFFRAVRLPPEPGG